MMMSYGFLKKPRVKKMFWIPANLGFMFLRRFQWIAFPACGRKQTEAKRKQNGSKTKAFSTDCISCLWTEADGSRRKPGTEAHGCMFGWLSDMGGWMGECGWLKRICGNGDCRWAGVVDG